MIYLTEEEHEELRKKAFDKNISMSGLVKHLLKFGNSVENNITEYKKEEKKPLDVTHTANDPEVKKKGSYNFFNPQPKKGKK